MKNKNLILCSFLSAVFFAGCNWHLPETISVKTQAEYNLAMGEFTKELETKFDVEKMSTEINIKDGKVYDYCPGGVLSGSKSYNQLQQFLIRVPIVEIPVDFSSYFSESTLAESFQDISFEKEVEIPAVEFKFEEEISMEEVMKTINLGMTFFGPATSGNIGYSLTFQKVSYLEGTMEIYCAGMDDYESVTISNGTAARNASFMNEVARISLDNFDFYNEGMHIDFSSPDLFKQYTATVVETSKIKEATGITVYQNPLDPSDTTLTEIPIPIDLTVDSISQDTAFESCVIGEGTLSSKVTIPAEWRNIGLAYDIQTTGGINIASERTDGVSKSIVLDGVVLQEGRTYVTANVYITLENASFTSGSNPTFTTDSDIKSFRKIIVNNTDITTSMDESDKLPDAVLDAVKSIKLTASGLSGIYTNSFPTGNDITLVANSRFFGLSNKSTLLRSDRENEVLDIRTPEGSENEVKLSKTPGADEFDEWDFRVDIRLPGYTPEHPERIEVSNVKPGDTYKISLVVVPDINWTEINIDSSQVQQQDRMNLGFNFSSILKSFGDEIGLNLDDRVAVNSIPIYLYCTRPVMADETSNPFTDAKFHGSIKMYAADASGNAIVDSNGNPCEEKLAENIDIGFVNEPVFDINTDYVVITDIDDYPVSLKKDMASFLNKASSSSNLWMDYDISFMNGDNGVITIKPEDLSPNSSASIGVSAMIVVPLKFNIINGDLEIDVKKIAKMETGKDILNREDNKKFEDFKKYSDAIRAIRLSYKAVALPFYAEPDAELVVDLNDGSTERRKKMSNGTLDLSAGTINYVLNTYPYNPDIFCLLQEGAVFSLPRRSELVMSMTVQVETDGEVVLIGD